MFPLQSHIKEMLLFWSLLWYVSQSLQCGSSSFRFPSQILCEEWVLHFQSLLWHVSESPEKELPHQVPLMKPIHGERCSISRAFFYVAFRKAPSCHITLSELPVRDTLHFEILLLLVSHKDPNKWASPSRFPNRTPVERCVFPDPALHYIKKICFIL
jgi:hypothetical protein